ncbi:MAG TPA: hypothetical protein PLC40_10750, partial [Candidatus Hydrogenedentes bacterium]|nr:hypothetical protein [Candidatus Hydrogenedentota bacterium]
GVFEDWSAVTVEYRDTAGDTAHRDYNGYGGLHYTDTSGRNDIITCKTAVDDTNVYFYAATRETLSPHTDPNWMLLLIDADKDNSTGWFGYDFLVNQSVISETATTLKRYVPENADGPWAAQGSLDYRRGEKELEIAVPRALLNLSGDALTFDFHWCDNPAELKDPISLCTHGDSAPNRRFNYRCLWQK